MPGGVFDLRGAQSYLIVRRARRCEKMPLGMVHRRPQQKAGEKCGLGARGVARVRLPRRGEFEGGESHLMRDSKGAFDKDSRCDSSPVFCIVAAEQATCSGAFKGFFGHAFHSAALANSPLLPSLSGDSPPQTPPPERASATRCPRETIGKFLERYGKPL